MSYYDNCDNCEEEVGENNLNEVVRDRGNMFVCLDCVEKLDDWNLIL